jgi:hypothetical protein
LKGCFAPDLGFGGGFVQASMNTTGVVVITHHASPSPSKRAHGLTAVGQFCRSDHVSLPSPLAALPWASCDLGQPATWARVYTVTADWLPSQITSTAGIVSTSLCWGPGPRLVLSSGQPPLTRVSTQMQAHEQRAQNRTPKMASTRPTHKKDRLPC